MREKKEIEGKEKGREMESKRRVRFTFLSMTIMQRDEKIKN